MFCICIGRHTHLSWGQSVFTALRMLKPILFQKLSKQVQQTPASIVMQYPQGTNQATWCHKSGRIQHKCFVWPLFCLLLPPHLLPLQSAESTQSRGGPRLPICPTNHSSAQIVTDQSEPASVSPNCLRHYYRPNPWYWLSNSL